LTQRLVKTYMKVQPNLCLKHVIS